MNRENEKRATELGKMIDRVRAAGLTEEADAFSNALWGFYRTLGAFEQGYPYLDNEQELKENGMTNKGAMHIVKYTIDHWCEKLGLKRKSEEQVLREDYADRRYHETHTS